MRIHPKVAYAPNGTTQRVMAELRAAPATSSELAAATGLPLHSISAILSQKFARGVVRRQRMHFRNRGHRYLYEVTT